MIFDHRHIDEIRDEEIHDLVEQHDGERQHLELKENLDPRASNQPFEVLKDIVSLANGGGGYLIVGIEDDGTGRAKDYSSDLGDDPEKIKDKIRSWCHDHIAERIIGLEILTRSVNRHPLVMVRVPDSDRVPHMVKFNDKTDFWRRYQDGKRSMTMSEIREAFAKDVVGRRLANIEGVLKRFMESQQFERDVTESVERLKTGVYPALTLIEDGRVLVQVCHDKFIQEKGMEKWWRIAATPLNPRGNLLNVDDPAIRSLVGSPPQSRYGGWNMVTGDMAIFHVERFAEGIRRGHKYSDYLELLSNGHMEFWSPLDESFCWQQSKEEFSKRPRLYPTAVTEYPVSFFRLFKAIMDAAESKTEFMLEIEYRNLKGYALPAYAPDLRGFIMRGTDAHVYQGQHYQGSIEVEGNFDPDKEAYSLLKVFYGTFGYAEKAIPFYDGEQERFVFE